MNAILRTFGKPRVLLAVVHCLNEKSAFDSSLAALDNGADGLFFVTHQNLNEIETFKIAANIRLDFARKAWIGANLLGFAPRWARGLLPRMFSGLWTDEHSFDGVDYGSVGDPLYFGGVAFKYTKPVHPEDEMKLAGLASRVMDVVTTSGSATGKAPSFDKVKRFREGCGEHALALASGVNIDNIEMFLPYVDAFLVGTGIETSFGVIDGNRVKQLAQVIHAYK